MIKGLMKAILFVGGGDDVAADAPTLFMSTAMGLQRTVVFR